MNESPHSRMGVRPANSNDAAMATARIAAITLRERYAWALASTRRAVFLLPRTSGSVQAPGGGTGTAVYWVADQPVSVRPYDPFARSSILRPVRNRNTPRM